MEIVRKIYEKRSEDNTLFKQTEQRATAHQCNGSTLYEN